jgi:hypothetical protein
MIVYNNANTTFNAVKIENECMRLGIEHRRVPQVYVTGDASIGCATSCEYAIKQHLNHDGYILLLDSDMFFVDDFSITEYMSGYDFSGILQLKEHVRYFTNQFLAMDMRTLPNKQDISLKCGEVDKVRVDVGGELHYYIMNNPQIRIKYIVDFICTNAYNAIHIMGKIRDVRLLDYFLRDINISGPYPELYIDQKVLHYRSGSNWNGFSNDIVEKRNKNLFDLLDKILSE